MRIDKNHYYLNIAKAVSLRGTCLRRNYGAVIVKDDRIVSTGYNGAPRGEGNCCDIGHCERQHRGVPSGQQYELCRSVHAEQNAVISAGTDMETGKDIETPDCCIMCKRVIKNAGIKQVYFLNAGGSYRVWDV